MRKTGWFVLGLLALALAKTQARDGNVMPSASPTGAAATSATLTILHTNDLHGHIRPWRGWDGDLAGKTIGGLDHLATAIRRVRAAAGEKNVLLVDAGDALGDTMIADLTRGEAILKVMDALHYDAMTLGNHEPDFSAELLRREMAGAAFPFIAANVKDRATGKRFTQPFVIREAAGIKVGILGLAYPNTPLTTARKNVAALEYLPDSAEIVKQCLPVMRSQGAQLMVVLSHLGLGADLKLADQAGGIDVIVSGHSHNRMAEPLRVGQTLIVQAGAHGSDLGRLDLTLRDGKVAEVRRELITLDNAAFSADPEIARLIDSIEAPWREQLDEPIGEVVAPIIRAQALAGQEPRKRNEQSSADSFFADILRKSTKSEAAFLPGVGYGVAIPAGPLTASALRNLIPHHSRVVTMTLTGAQIRQILEQAVENTYTEDPQKKVGGMIQVSGLIFSYDPQGAPQARVHEVKVLGQPLAPDRRYTVATNSMLAEGGHNYRTFLEGQDRREREGQYETVKQWMKRQGKIQPPTDQRILSLAGANHERESQAPAASVSASASVSAVDPVCGMKVDPAEAKYQSKYAGRQYYFCSQYCRDKFNSHPQDYDKAK